MSLTSVNYILFLLASVIIFYLVPHRYRNHLIFLASLGFYLFFSPQMLLILMFYIWIIYFLGQLIGKGKPANFWITIAGIVGSIAILVFFRILSSLKLGDLAPLGLSYCILQSISYLRQIKSGKIPPVKSPVDLFAFLLFFPKIMAGPVEDPESFFQKLENAAFSQNNIYRGLPLIAIGMAKKLAVAEILTPAVAVTFDTMTTGSGLGALIGIISYSLVILFDFSGYTDIAMGSALLFGLELTENFKNPYFAIGMIDFWKRWHISLTSWLRTNIYFSLGGSRVSKKERYLNVLTIFMISGIWHGTTLSFLTWGMYHGLLQTIELFIMEKTGYGKNGKKLPIVLKPVLWLLTFTLATIGWVLFRASDLDNAFRVLSTVTLPWTDFGSTLTALGLTVGGLAFACLSIAVTTLLKDLVMKKNLSYFSSCIICTIAVLLALFGVILMGSSAGSSFIYFNF